MDKEEDEEEEKEEEERKKKKKLEANTNQKNDSTNTKLTLSLSARDCARYTSLLLSSSSLFEMIHLNHQISLVSSSRRSISSSLR